MEKLDKKKVIGIIILAYVLVIGLLILVASSLKRSPSEESGLFKSDNQVIADQQPVRQTEQERLDEYESREEMPEVTEETFYETVRQLLSYGSFTELDATLRRWQETYKDSTDESESKTAMIEQYRGDLAYCKSIVSSGSSLDVWQFKTPDTLAACVSFTPIMQKYKAFVNQNSVIFPAMTEGSAINLSQSKKTNEELASIKSEINRTRTDENAFQQIAVYDLTVKGYPCEFIAVMDRNSMTWMPYSLKVTNNMVDLPTVSIGKEILRSNDKADLDVIIAIPSMISEQPDGMTGNIDHNEETVTDGQALPPVEIPGATAENSANSVSNVSAENQDSDSAEDEVSEPAGNSRSGELGD